MIEIKCGRNQFNRIINAMVYSALSESGKCIMGKNEWSCPYLRKGDVADCPKCIKQNVRRVE